ncbi:expressed unknown protein [Seminavis robusta]|uniref:Uncharacterized protein n=1 Tax=Seminavis robusta TaxID=568900 RepID=A0A9N8EDV9_9STRA|nr:expressed unknown protein [Seminavis robusta]|eukprot:Sro933_g221770.1 n/a (623) ;mRNA; f:15523-17636
MSSFRSLAFILVCSFSPAVVYSKNSASASSSYSSSLDAREPVVCGCHECTEAIVDRQAGEHSCAERIQFLVDEYQLPEEEACIRVARTEFRDICGPECDPGRCDGNKLPPHEMPSTYCGCKHCTHEVWNRITTQHHTCGARISYLADFNGLPTREACNIVGGHEFPHEDDCGLCDPDRCEPVLGTGEYRCGCSRCTNAIWDLELDHDGATCGERIEFLQDVEGQTEVRACRQVTGIEYPQLCGSNCNPDLCDSPLAARTPLYCFPDFDERERYRNFWGNFTVEVKESKVEERGICGPHDNKFTASTVSRVGPNRLKLQFKKSAGQSWIGSEVRVRLPNADMPFRYGSFSFSVESVQVVNVHSGEVESDNLPPSLVLSMHTWDATENFATHENQNHQVGVDISRFDDAAGEDAQFAAQPEIVHRFFTGRHNNYKQAPRIHGFHWRPAEIEFFSKNDQGRSTSFTYSTEEALEAGYIDFTQCLPADVELRIGLWHIYGSNPPPGLADNHIVEVVIDEVSYTPSGLEFVEEGRFCSKDCHCSPHHKCFGGRCTRVASHYDAVIASQLNPKLEQPQKASVRTIMGLTVFSCSVGALALIVWYQGMRSEKKNEGPAEFSISHGAVKG